MTQNLNLIKLSKASQHSSSCQMIFLNTLHYRNPRNIQIMKGLLMGWSITCTIVRFETRHMWHVGEGNRTFYFILNRPKQNFPILHFLRHYLDTICVHKLLFLKKSTLAKEVQKQLFPQYFSQFLQQLFAHKQPKERLLQTIRISSIFQLFKRFRNLHVTFVTIV